MNKKIMFTGGGSSGHVAVNLALIPHLLEQHWSVQYIGSEQGIERNLISGLEDVCYFSIATGKLRRYFDWNNVKDPFKVLKGISQAYRIIKKEKPDIIFSKGGFVSVPVVLAGWLNKVPVIIHESDLTPGLANKISSMFATEICTTFPETTEYFRSKNTRYIGAIVRDELKEGKAAKGLAYCGFTRNKPIMLIMGGSLGSKKINELVWLNLEALLAHFQIVHICGKDQVNESIRTNGYQQFEYINDELADVMTMADMVVSRAGSNSIFEFLTLRKPMLLIPLSKAVSRGDQILNAKSFKAQGLCEFLEEEDLESERFVDMILRLYEKRSDYIRNMEKINTDQSTSKLLDLIKVYA
ncbi:undecaprenyldiphospho-muramoylpentapeptide beta-N-acetylglucosaminyltransferase [Paenibacillus sp. BT-177]|uniref:undecaprenyldiphospho-muramoylpentapeptide beta-N-acetylglucosaminyltransferase n=1 Tax=Paenibacillus sp. BT-177 TaxID=2986930 RepID=UPI0021F79374|nr:undecaprenyldiphospho-muramoylpentapeptide beta-N-acetylglucosaminyltransferase [Paenibacillus sp. BT-177]